MNRRDALRCIETSFSGPIAAKFADFLQEMAADPDGLQLEPADLMTLADLANWEDGCDEACLRVVASLFREMHAGSLCLPLEKKALASIAGEGVAGDFLSHLAARRYDDIIGDETAYKPLILVQRRGTTFLYFQRWMRADERLWTLRARLLASSSPVPSLPSGPLKTAAARDRLAEILDSGRHPMRGAQALAVALPLFHRLAIVSGGPGTGKTTVIARMVRYLIACGVPSDRIRLAAPTGRAAFRISAAVSAETGAGETVEGVTLHRLLLYSPNARSCRRNAHNPVPADFVILDEASMADAWMMARLIEALEPEARLVLVGDKDQLPSVDAGAVLSWMTSHPSAGAFAPPWAEALTGLMPQDAIRLGEIVVPGGATESETPSHVVYLDRNYRSQRSIAVLAERVHAEPPDAAGTMALLDRREKCAGPSEEWFATGEADSKPLLYTDPAGLKRMLAAWMRHRFGGGADYGRRAALPCAIGVTTEVQTTHIRSLITASLSAQVLCVGNDGPLGRRSINDFMLGRTPAGDEHLGLPAGAPIIVVENDYDLELFNGDRGVILPMTDGSLRAFFDRGRSIESFPLDRLPPFEPAFAITVHKSQGSEFEHVLLILPEAERSRLLTREILYTGLTRARRGLTLLAPEGSIEAALGRRIVRRSGFFQVD